MTIRFADHLLTGDHASRPAATAVPAGTLYSCTTHSLIYQSSGSAWSTYATLGGSTVTDATITTTDVTTNNVSTSKHGWAPKADGNSAHYLDGTGAYSTPAGGGGGSTSATYATDGKPWNSTIPASPNAKDDEFGDASGQSGPVNGLAGKWSKHNLATSAWLSLSDTKAPGCLQILLPAGQTADQAIYQTVPAGDFTVSCRVSAHVNDRQIWGLLIVDSSGNGVAMSLDYTQGQELRLMALSAWVQTGTVSTYTLSSLVPMGFGIPTYMYLKKTSGVYTAFASHDDRVLSGGFLNLELSLTPTAFTAANVGFGRFFGGTNASVMNLDWFRIA